MTYEQRVEAYGDVCLKFATLLEQDVTKLEQVVATVLANEVPKSEEPVRFYLQQIYARYKPLKGSWLFKQASKSNKQAQFVPSTIKSKRKNAWITDLQKLKVQERAALFTALYLQLEDGAISELMQTPIDAVRSYVKSAAVKLERIVEKHEQSYINETNFKQYFDEDFGSTYNAKRRLKQLHIVAELKKVKPQKPKRPVPKWVPVIVACLVFFSSLATPFAYHQSKKIPFFNEQMLEAAIIMNSISQPYYQTIHDNYKMYIDHMVYVASMAHFIQKLDIDMSTYDEEVEKLKTEFAEYRSLIYERDEKIQNFIFSKLGIQYEDYLSHDIEVQARFNIAYEQMTPEQQNDMHNYNVEFQEKYKEQIEALYEQYDKYDSVDSFRECTIQKVHLVKEEENREESEADGFYSSTYIPEQTQLCILPNGDVTYVYIDNVYNYFDPLIFELEEKLNTFYNPFNYYMFYEYLVEKESLTQFEMEFMQMTQILAYAYELTYPGWIEPVPILKSEDLIFLN